jgi:hypothetical protein
MTSISPKPRSVFSAVCRSNGIVLGRTRATVGSRFSLNASLASASHSNPAAFILPGGGPLRRSVEPTLTPMAPLLRIIVLGPRTILNLVRPLSAGSSLCVAFIDHCREPFDRIRSTFQFAPVTPSVVVHMSNSDRRKRQGVVT